MFTTCESFIAIGRTVCVPVGQHRIRQLLQFLNFQNHREYVYNNLWKFYRSRMNGVCYSREKATPGTSASTILKFLKFPKPPSFIAIGRTVCPPVGQRWVFQLVQFLIFLNFQDHREYVYNNLWKFHRNRINGMCSCKATPITPASTIFFLISKTIAAMFATTFERFIATGWTVCASVSQTECSS